MLDRCSDDVARPTKLGQLEIVGSGACVRGARALQRALSTLLKALRELVEGFGRVGNWLWQVFAQQVLCPILKSFAWGQYRLLARNG